MKKFYQSGEHSISTQENIRAINCHIARAARSAWDIGCDEGLNSCALDNLGIQVQAYEPVTKTAEYAQEFIARNKQRHIKFFNKNVEMEDFLHAEDVDVMLLLSVHHQIVNIKGLEYANLFLQEVFKKCRMQLFFQPALIYPKYGRSMPFKENDILGAFDYFCEVIKETGELVTAEIINITHNFMPPSEQYRPLFLFSKGVYETGRQVPSMEDYASNPEHYAGYLVNVDIDSTVAPDALQSFASDKWHYMVEACREIISGVDADRSILHKYYATIQPATMGEVFVLAGYSQDIGTLADWSLADAGMPMLCQEKEWLGDTKIPADKRHSFGPLEREYVSHHIDILNELIGSIKEKGYSPELFIDGHITGSIMKRGDSCKFYILSGQHRLAVLSALGYKNFVAKLYPGFVPLLDSAAVDEWPVVQKGIYSKEQALNIFNAFFDTDGSWCVPLLDKDAAVVCSNDGFASVLNKICGSIFSKKS